MSFFIRTIRRPSGLCAILAGLLWILFIYSIHHEPPPFSYDDYNRMLTLPLILMLAAYAGLAKTFFRRLGKRGRWPFGIGLAGFSLLAAGNILEFWMVLLQSAPNAFAAYKTGSSHVFFGSYWGWGTFIVGYLLVAAASLLTGIFALLARFGVVRSLLIAAFGTVGFFSFNFESLIVPFGIGWMAIGAVLIKEGSARHFE